MQMQFGVQQVLFQIMQPMVQQLTLQTQINTLTSNAYTGTDFDTDFSAKSTTDLSEGTNLYYTDARVASYLAAGEGIDV